MYAKGTIKGTVRFKLNAARPINKAALAGDFNGWKPVAMKKQKDGFFTATVSAGPGRYEYKFIIDGDWVHDTDVPTVVKNPYGTFNSVAVVK